MDPRGVLGVSADADEEAIAVAYRKLAKRYHPDHAPGDEAAAVRMAEINTAYAILRDAGLEMHRARAPKPAVAPARTRRPGDWLDDGLRRALGHELLGALEPEEPIVLVTDAATWDSPRVRLCLSDRRLLWLNADAPTERVRSLPLKAIAALDGRLKRPRRRVGELRVTPRQGRKVSFSELEPDALRLLLLGLRRHVPA